jgi:hypothetical protein
MKTQGKFAERRDAFMTIGVIVGCSREILSHEPRSSRIFIGQPETLHAAGRFRPKGIWNRPLVRAKCGFQ